MYAAMGNCPKTGGTTRLHLDITDAANLLVWAREPDEVAAIWHIFPRNEVDRLRQAMHELDLSRDAIDPILSQDVYLTESVLETLANKYALRPVRFEQRVGDLIVIPAGSPHQVGDAAPPSS